MKTKKTAALTLLALVMAASAAPSAPVPRRSPDFTINEPSGKQVQLSSFKGKVVMVEFLFLRSPKCLDVVQTMNKLNADLGSRGFQPVAIAFPAPQSDANQALVGALADGLKLTYPVGYTTKEDVDRFLSRSGQDTLRIPQVVIIDRAGMIRAQTGGRNGDLRLEGEAYLRTVIEGLLKESPAPVAPAKQTPAQKSQKNP
jgi:peroxiredoxin